MEKQLLKERDIFPSDEVLSKESGNDVYGVFEQLRSILTAEGLTYDWHYYNDGAAWLCKVVYRKTVFWLSIWEGHFQVAFYFLERHLEGLAALGIDEKNAKLMGEWAKMIPLIFKVRDEKPIPDILKTVEFKKKAK